MDIFLQPARLFSALSLLLWGCSAVRGDTQTSFKNVDRGNGVENVTGQIQREEARNHLHCATV